MVWKLTKKAEGWEPLPGIPWRDMSDDEFREKARMYSEVNGGAQHGFGPKALENSGFFEHAEDKADKPAKEEA